jgi:hypothetical protein
MDPENQLRQLRTDLVQLALQLRAEPARCQFLYPVGDSAPTPADEEREVDRLYSRRRNRAVKSPVDAG